MATIDRIENLKKIEKKLLSLARYSMAIGCCVYFSLFLLPSGPGTEGNNDLPIFSSPYLSSFAIFLIFMWAATLFSQIVISYARFMAGDKKAGGGEILQKLMAIEFELAMIAFFFLIVYFLAGSFLRAK